MKNLANLDPSQYLRILWHRRWYALAGFVLVILGTAIYSWRTQDVYRSQSMIMVEQNAIPQDYARPSDRSSPEEQIAAIRQAVQSRSFAERIIQEFQLFGYGRIGLFSMDDAIEALGKNIQVVSTSRNTFQISAVSTNAQLAQTILRRIVDTLIQSSNSSRKTRAVEADQFLDEQLSQTQKKLVDQEDNIRKFKMAHLGGLSEQSYANMNALSGLKEQLAAAENALQQMSDQQKQADLRVQQQKQLLKLTSSILDQSPSSSSSEIATKSPKASNPLLVAREADLRALSMKYTPNHPDVVRVKREVEELKRQEEANISQELSPVAGSQGTVDPVEGNADIGSDAMLDIEAAEDKVQAETYKRDIARREKERESILAQIKIYQSRLNLAPALEQEYMVLSRAYENIKQQYANLQNKKFQAELTTSLETGKNSDTYRIIDEANLPGRPSFPNRMQIILLGLCGGIVLGIGAAFGREWLDSSLGSEDEATALLKLPVLGTISEMTQKEPARRLRIGGMAKSS